MSRRTTAGITALVAVNAVLVPIALRAGSSASGPGAAAGAVDATAGTRAWMMPRRTGPSGVWTGRPVLDVIDGLAAYAPAEPGPVDGPCGGTPAELRLSTDGGRTWRAVTVPAALVLRVRIAGQRRIWLVGADAECRYRVHHTLDAGATWQTVDSTANTWHLGAGPGTGQVHTPRSPVTSPCPPDQPAADLTAESGSTAAVRCRDGAVHRTDDGGRTWTATGPDGARAVALAGRQALHVVTGPASDCAGATVWNRTGSGDDWRPTGCVPDVPAEAALALSFVDADEGVLVARTGIGTVTYATTDAGRTWQRRTVS